jgi:hypothetical protein
MSVRNLSLFGSDWVGSKLLEVYHLHFSTLVIANGVVSLLAVPLIFLLPGFMVDSKESETSPPGPAPRLGRVIN